MSDAMPFYPYKADGKIILVTQMHKDSARSQGGVFFHPFLGGLEQKSPMTACLQLQVLLLRNTTVGHELDSVLSMCLICHCSLGVAYISLQKKNPY